MKDNSFDSEANNSFDSDLENETESKSPKEETQLKNNDLINAISLTLSTIIEENKKLPNYKEILMKQSKMIFSSKTIPNISIYDYLIRIQTYSVVEKSTLILSLIYIDKLCQICKLTLTFYNIHRIVFAAILIAIKYNEDNFYDNKYYAEIAGVKLKELKLIEYQFVDLIDFNLYVSDELFNKYNINLTSFQKNQTLKEIE